MDGCGGLGEILGGSIEDIVVIYLCGLIWESVECGEWAGVWDRGCPVVFAVTKGYLMMIQSDISPRGQFMMRWNYSII